MSNILILIALCLMNVSLIQCIPPGSIPMKIINNAGFNVDLYWNNHFAKKDKSSSSSEAMVLVKQPTSPIKSSGDTIVNLSSNRHIHIRPFPFLKLLLLNQKQKMKFSLLLMIQNSKS